MKPPTRAAAMVTTRTVAVVLDAPSLCPAEVSAEAELELAGDVAVMAVGEAFIGVDGDASALVGALPCAIEKVLCPVMGWESALTIRKARV